MADGVAGVCPTDIMAPSKYVSSIDSYLRVVVNSLRKKQGTRVAATHMES
jgi:hypothetical protein